MQMKFIKGLLPRQSASIRGEVPCWVHESRRFVFCYQDLVDAFNLPTDLETMTMTLSHRQLTDWPALSRDREVMMSAWGEMTVSRELSNAYPYGDDTATVHALYPRAEKRARRMLDVCRVYYVRIEWEVSDDK